MSHYAPATRPRAGHCTKANKKRLCMTLSLLHVHVPGNKRRTRLVHVLFTPRDDVIGALWARKAEYFAPVEQRECTKIF